MNKKHFALIASIILSIQGFSQPVAIDLNNSPDIRNFDCFFKEDIPLDSIIIQQNRYYSDDKNFYVLISDKPREYILKSKYILIKKLPFSTWYDRFYWLNNCLVLKTFTHDQENHALHVVDLRDHFQVKRKKEYKLTTYETNGYFSFIGQTDSACYFYTSKDSTYIGDFLIPEGQTIFAVNEKGLVITDKKRLEENNIRRLYYNGTFSIISKKNPEGNTEYSFHYFDSVWTYSEPVKYFNDRDVFYTQESNYVKLNTKHIYRFNKDGVEKVIDCDTLSIEDFMIENNHLIYSRYFHPQKPLIGIINLNTMKIHYPVICKTPKYQIK